MNAPEELTSQKSKLKMASEEIGEGIYQWWNPIGFVSSYTLARMEKQFGQGNRYDKEIKKRFKLIEKISAKVGSNPGVIRIEMEKNRAAGYLYGAREITPKDQMAPNPLVDICTLIFCPDGYKPGMEFQLAVVGPPEQLERRTKENDRRQKQYAYSENKLKEQKVFRTLSRFGEWQRSLTRGLYVFAKVTDRYPELVEETLDEYVETATDKKGNTAGMAVGILELLYNMELLDDPRFARFNASLRNIVLEEMVDYDDLKGQYFYRVVQYAPFWLEGEKKLQAERAILYGKEEVDSENRENAPMVFPNFDQWNLAVRQREEDINTIEHLTPFNAITKSAQNSAHTLDAFAADVRNDMRKKSELAEAVRLQNQRLPFGLKKLWESWLGTLSKQRKTTPSDAALIDEATRLLMGQFTVDRNLSRKTASRLSSADNLYPIDSAALSQSPLFNWIFALRDDRLAASLEKSVVSQPAEFSLLLRLMTYETAARFFRKKESKLLFDPDYQRKADPESLKRLVVDLRDLVNRHKPDVKTIFLQTLAEGEGKIADLFDKKRLKRIQKNLNEITFEQIAPLIAIDKSKKTTRRAVLLAIRDASIVAVGVSALGGLLTFLIDKLGKYPGAVEARENLKQATDNAKKRNPEAINPEELKRLEPFFFANVVNLPRKYFTGFKGETIGYFPTTLSGQDGDYWSYSGQIPERVTIVDSLERYKISGNKDDLVIVPAKISYAMFPPIGWEIVQVIQEDGAKPDFGTLGQVYFRADYQKEKNPPKKAMLVMKKIPDNKFIKLSLGVSYLPNNSEKTNISRFILNDATRVNQLLRGDSKLQSLHYQLIKEVSQNYEDHSNSGLDKLSTIAIKYTLLYERYTNESRFYALKFLVNDDKTEVDSLKAIADNPNRGYYCLVASQAYRQFMASAGFWVMDQPGFNMKDFENSLWGDIGHQNNLLILPNGTVAYVDMTPPVTDKTPREDIEALQGKPPSPEKLVRKEEEESIASLAMKYGVGTVIAAGALYGTYELYKTARHKLVVRQVERLLENTKDLLPLERELLTATVNYLAYLPYDKNFYTEATKTLDNLNQFIVKKHGAAVHWLINNHVGLLNSNDPVASYKKLLDLYQDQPEVLKSYFPDETDFRVVYESTRIINRNKYEVFKRKAYSRLGTETGAEQAVEQATYKANDILEMVRERIYDDKIRRQHMIREENIGLYNAIYNSLQSFETEAV